jgi:hypothetical protein
MKKLMFITIVLLTACKEVKIKEVIIEPTVTIDTIISTPTLVSTYTLSK